jgi:hypothetical protein
MLNEHQMKIGRTIDHMAGELQKAAYTIAEIIDLPPNAVPAVFAAAMADQWTLNFVDINDEANMEIAHKARVLVGAMFATACDHMFDLMIEGKAINPAVLPTDPEKRALIEGILPDLLEHGRKVAFKHAVTKGNA